MSTATGPSSCWCADRRRTGNGHKIQYVWNRSRFGPPRRLFLVGYGAKSAGGQRRPLLRRGYKGCGTAGRCGHRPLRNRIMGCVGEGLCPSHGRGRTPPLRRGYKEYGKTGRRGRRPLRRGHMKRLRAGRCGERTERCQWQKQRSVRVAAVKISSVRRKAAQKFWAPQQGHRPLRNRIMGCVGEG